MIGSTILVQLRPQKRSRQTSGREKVIREARAQSKTVITGAQVLGLQALGQFILYTGITPSEQQVTEAIAVDDDEREPGRGPQWRHTRLCRLQLQTGHAEGVIAGQQQQ